MRISTTPSDTTLLKTSFTHTSYTLLVATLCLSCSTKILPSSEPQPTIEIACTNPSQPFQIKLLPAVSKDRSLVAHAISFEDSPRGAHNLTLQIRDPSTDTLVSETLILPAKQRWSCDDDHKPVQERIDAALETLSKHTWEPMLPLEIPTPPVSAPEGAAIATHTASKLVLSYREPHIWAISTLHNRSLRAPMYTWAAQSLPSLHDHPMPCTQPGHLAYAWTSPNADTIAVQLYYTGNDACTEPDSRFFTLSLPQAPADQPSCIQSSGFCASACPEDTRALPKLQCTKTDVCCLPTFQAELLFPSPSPPETSPTP